MDVAASFVVLALGASLFAIHRGQIWKRPLHISSLEGKHVFITGSSSGIGLATLTGRNAVSLQDAVADVGDYKLMLDAIQESFAWKPIDVLICNAGLTLSGYLDQVPVEDLDLIVCTNILGGAYPVHALLPLMKKRSPGHPMAIVLMGSLASLYTLYGNTMYTATKYALKGFGEGLRLELLPYSIRVSLICPGSVQIPFLDEVEKPNEFHTLMKDINHYDQNQAQSEKRSQLAR